MVCWKDTSPLSLGRQSPHTPPSTHLCRLTVTLSIRGTMLYLTASVMNSFPSDFCFFICYPINLISGQAGNKTLPLLSSWGIFLVFSQRSLFLLSCWRFSWKTLTVCSRARSSQQEYRLRGRGGGCTEWLTPQWPPAQGSVAPTWGLSCPSLRLIQGVSGNWPLGPRAGRTHTLSLATSSLNLNLWDSWQWGNPWF